MLVKPLASKLGLKMDGLKSFTTDVWVDKASTGPIFLAEFTPNATMSHAIVVSGLVGETTMVDALKFRLIDPAGAKSRVQNFRETIKFYEGLAAAGVPQLLYY